MTIFDDAMTELFTGVDWITKSAGKLSTRLPLTIYGSGISQALRR